MNSLYRFLLLLVCLYFLASALIAQNFVSTEPLNKNVILEEFTGVRCPNCPDGHTVAQSILDNNPGRVWVIGFHPYNSSYTEPYGNDPDFRRHHPDSLYMIPYCGTSRYMPSAFINRRVYAGERIQGRSVWAAKTDEHLAEPSPVNVGLNTSYDENSHLLVVEVEVYFTADVTDITTLNVLFTESGLIAQQAGGTTNYVHKRVFREVFTSQWGDPIEPAIQGTYLQYSFTFDNTAGAYNMDECEVIAYLVNDNTDEVVSGIGCEAGGNTAFYPPVAEFEADSTLILQGGSVDFTDLSTGAPSSWLWTFEGAEPSSSMDQHPEDILYNSPGIYTVTLTVTNANGSDTETKTGLITVHSTSAISHSAEEQLLAYPVPSSGQITLEIPSNITLPVKINVVDLSGKTVFSHSIQNGRKYCIDLSNFAPGRYILLIANQETLKTQEIIIRQ